VLREDVLRPINVTVIPDGKGIFAAWGSVSPAKTEFVQPQKFASVSMAGRMQSVQNPLVILRVSMVFPLLQISANVISDGLALFVTFHIALRAVASAIALMGKFASAIRATTPLI